MKIVLLILSVSILVSCKSNLSVFRFENTNSTFSLTCTLKGKEEIRKWKNTLYANVAKDNDVLLLEYVEDSSFYQFDVYSVKHNACLASGYGQLCGIRTNRLDPKSIYDIKPIFYTCGLREVRSYDYNSRILQELKVMDNKKATIKHFNEETEMLERMRIVMDFPVGSIDSTFYFDADGVCNKLIVSEPRKLQTILFFDVD